MTPPFDQTEALVQTLASEWALTWRETVHLEAAINGLYFELGRPSMDEFVPAIRMFLRDVYDNVLYIDTDEKED